MRRCAESGRLREGVRADALKKGGVGGRVVRLAVVMRLRVRPRVPMRRALRLVKLV